MLAQAEIVSPASDPSELCNRKLSSLFAVPFAFACGCGFACGFDCASI
jgi:hypothetical protein